MRRSFVLRESFALLVSTLIFFGPQPARSQVSTAASTNVPPTVRFTSPIRGGSAFLSPARVPLAVSATDRDGTIASVEFIAQDRVIATITKPPYAFTWSNAVPGTYSIIARAVDDKGGVGAADVSIRIDAPSIVRLEGRGELTVSEANVTLEPFVVHRTGNTGNTNEPLVVSYAVTGSAIPARDYAALSGNVRIEARSLSAAIPLRIFDDALAEDRETITLSLLPGTGYTVQPSNSVTVTILDNERMATNQPPTVRFLAPSNGALFTNQVTLRVEATDRDGSIVAVDLISQDRVIARLTNAPYTFVWSNSVPGLYTVLARVRDDKGAIAVAQVMVRIAGALPAVSILVRGESSVSERNVVIEPFVIKREGPTNQPLVVSYSVAGSAIDNRDYGHLPGSLTINAGALSAAIPLRILDDALLEEPETITLTLRPGNLYAISSPSNATITIIDNDRVASNQPPRITLIEPANGKVFSAPAQIRLLAEASDPDGYVQTVEFFAGDRSLGTKTNFPMVAGALNPFQLIWSNVLAGVYTLTAKATDNNGATTFSSVSRITVGGDRASASLTITSPKNGAAFTAPATIPIQAVAIDPNGYISRVEFYQGSTRIGVSEIVFIRAPDPGEPIHHSFEWKNVPAGKYTLTARAVDTLSRVVVSPAVQITVGSNSTAPTGFVTRELPAGYAPGVPFLVTLRASPPATAHVYAVEDRPPAGWAVSRISNDGIFDPVAGKVKFGPFFDATARTLSYLLTPPTNATGRREFEGIGALDGTNTPIGGARVIETTSRHPADLNPANNAISISELTAYAAAWRTGQTWPVGPNPIPISYVTRAGALWKGGEVYVYDPAAGALPLAWVNPPPRPVALPPPASTVGRSSTAFRTFSPPLPKGSAASPIYVRINVSPRAAASYAIEEKIPPGLNVIEVSAGGRLDLSKRVIRWGPFSDGQPRIVYYEVQPVGNPSWSLLQGTLSTDGSDRAVVGTPGPAH